MIFKGIFAIFLVAVSKVTCEPPSTQYGTPISSYGTPNYNTDHNDHDHSEPKSYEFGYQVKDDYTGNNYKRQEASDGNQVQGEYRVQLPDGRTQIVTYYADWQTGFHADVKYEGQASYPENYNNNGIGGGPGFGDHGFGGHGFSGPQGTYGAPHQGPISNQYGVPGFGGNFNGGLNNFNAAPPATSSVSIKDYSGPGTPYNVGGGYGNSGNGHNLNGGHNFGNQGGFDSYSHAGSFGNKIRPSSAYGAPSF